MKRRFGNRDFALGRLKRGERNKTEAEYERALIDRQQAGTVLWHQFQSMTLVLAKDTRYTPDFNVMAADGVLEMHEVKGFMRDDANVKIKVAAELFPFRFFLVRKRAKKDGGGFSVEEIGHG
jgi:hypothetical protein